MSNPVRVVADPVSHGYGAGINGAKAFRVAFQQQFALVIPEFDKFLGFFLDHLMVEGGRHIGETFAHPLVAIGSEADRMSPPLVRDLVRRNHLPVAAVALVHAQLMTDGGIEVIADRYPYEFRPRLSKVARCLLREGTCLKREGPK